MTDQATEIKERGIIFSGEMVRALLNGTKTQTRRVMKWKSWPDIPVESIEEHHTPFLGSPPNEYSCTADHVDVDGNIYVEQDLRCPYGLVGDRLWVRETASYYGDDSGIREVMAYAADVESRKGMKWKPSIYMPRWASRITLEVVDVRVEQVQDICAYDALLEGIQLPELAGCKMPTRPPEYENWSESKRDDYVKAQARAIYMSQLADCQDHVDEFSKLWDSINAKRGYSWESNPWVWVITFKLLEGGDA